MYVWVTDKGQHIELKLPRGEQIRAEDFQCLYFDKLITNLCKYSI